jgi:hypothetical protein
MASGSRLNGVPDPSDMESARRQKRAEGRSYFAVTRFDVDPDLGALRVALQQVQAAQHVAEARGGRRRGRVLNVEELLCALDVLEREKLPLRVFDEGLVGVGQPIEKIMKGLAEKGFERSASGVRSILRRLVDLRTRLALP